MIAGAKRRSRCASSVSAQRPAPALRNGGPARPAGIVLLAALIGGADRGNDLGWAAAPIFAALPLAAGAFAVPIAVERHATEPMLDHVLNPMFPAAGSPASAPLALEAR